MTNVDADSAEGAISEAQRLCDSGPVMNLTLTFPMTPGASREGFLASYREDALRWQSKVAPGDLFFNHGNYMHADGEPIDYLVRELTFKPTSNRACISLVDSKPIYASGDGRLPSFMLVQVGFREGTRDPLHITAYYRALETTAFLPLNVTELSLIADEIADHLPSINKILVTIHAFRAHSIPGFRAHLRCRLDMASSAEIHDWVEGRELDDLASMLIEKAAPATIIEDSGLSTLREEVGLAGWSTEFVNTLDLALSALTRLRTKRAAGTHEESIARTQSELDDHLYKAASLIVNE
jgi:hypothetical protein